jgi:hypothetical protein
MQSEIQSRLTQITPRGALLKNFVVDKNLAGACALFQKTLHVFITDGKAKTLPKKHF